MASSKTSEYYNTTCHVVDPDTVIVQGMRFVRERTCKNEAPMWNRNAKKELYKFVCSECGYNEPKKDVDSALCLSIFDTKHCRNCGAKVVS